MEVDTKVVGRLLNLPVDFGAPIDDRNQILDVMADHVVAVAPPMERLDLGGREIGRTGDVDRESVRELDTLGELQLDAGLRKQAMATVRLIISLGPKNVDAYRELLARL